MFHDSLFTEMWKKGNFGSLFGEECHQVKRARRESQGGEKVAGVRESEVQWKVVNGSWVKLKPTLAIQWETDLRGSRREAVSGNLSREEADMRRAVESASPFVRGDRQAIV